PFSVIPALSRLSMLGPDGARDLGRAYSRVALEEAQVPRGLPFSVETLDRVEAAYLHGMRLDGLRLDEHASPKRHATGGRAFSPAAGGAVLATTRSPSRCVVTRG